jgi:hypothetical protein
MVKKSITIDDLAVMVQKGFADTATKSDIKVLTERFDKVDKRFDKIESLILENYIGKE